MKVQDRLEAILEELKGVSDSVHKSCAAKLTSCRDVHFLTAQSYFTEAMKLGKERGLWKKVGPAKWERVQDPSQPQTRDEEVYSRTSSSLLDHIQTLQQLISIERSNPNFTHETREVLRDAIVRLFNDLSDEPLWVVLDLLINSK